MPTIELSSTRPRRAGGTSSTAGTIPRTIGHTLRGVLAAGATLLMVACGPPVGVSRVSPRDVSRDLTRSALNSSTPSEFSQNVLHRWDLRERFRRDPEAALAQLHQLVVEGRGRDTTLFALAELSFAHAEATGKRDYYLEAAVSAWAFLFPGGEGERPDEFDPRLRIAADLYNRGLTRALASRGRLGRRPALRPVPASLRPAGRGPPGAGRAAMGRPGAGRVRAGRRAPGAGPRCAAPASGDRRAPGRPGDRHPSGCQAAGLPRSGRQDAGDGSAAHRRRAPPAHAAGDPRLARGLRLRSPERRDRRTRGPARGRAERGARVDAEPVPEVAVGTPGILRRRPAATGAAHEPDVRRALPSRAHPGGARARHPVERRPMGRHAERPRERRADTRSIPVLALPLQHGQPDPVLRHVAARRAHRRRRAVRSRRARIRRCTRWS